MINKPSELLKQFKVRWHSSTCSNMTHSHGLGLDPVSHLFEEYNVTLDQSTARFVDVIHTSAANPSAVRNPVGAVSEAAALTNLKLGNIEGKKRYFSDVTCYLNFFHREWSIMYWILALCFCGVFSLKITTSEFLFVKSWLYLCSTAGNRHFEESWAWWAKSDISMFT